MKDDEDPPKFKLIVAASVPNALELRPADAYLKMAERFQQYAEKELVAVNIDVPRAVATIVGAAPDILRLRPLLAALATFDVTKADTLNDAALALAHAYTQCSIAAPEVHPAAVARALRKVRRQLNADAAVLVDRRLMDGKQLARLRGGPSYRMIAFDVLGLVDVFKQSWEDIAGLTAVSLEELNTASAAANRLLVEVGCHQASQLGMSPTTLAFRQAYTLLVRDYADVRLAVHFVRRNEGDGELIAPTLFPRKKRRTGKAKDTQSKGKRRGPKTTGGAGSGDLLN